MLGITKRAAAAVAGIMTFIIIGLRLTTPELRLPNGSTALAYGTIGGIAAVLLVLFFLCGRIPERTEIRINGRFSAAYTGVLFGTMLLVKTGYDIYRFFYLELLPPPNEKANGTVDAVLAMAVFVLGVAGGAAMIASVLRWARTGTCAAAVRCLLPVLWGWVRLARYELSYTSAVDISKSFYYFVTYIFMLLFLFAFARFLSSVGSAGRLLFYACGTAMLGISGSVVQTVRLLERGEDTAVALLSIAVDFSIGLLAAAVAVGLAFDARERPEPEAPADPMPETGTEAQQESKQLMEDIFREQDV